jgi:hypothetical protein
MARAAVLALRADIDRLAATAPPDGLAPAAIAERLSVSPRAMTFRRALWSAVADGGWIAEGSSKARRYRPATTTVAGEDPLPAPSRTCRYPLVDGEGTCVWCGRDPAS